MFCPAETHAALRLFFAVFRAVRGFSRAAAAGFLALGTALTTDGNSSLGCFAVRWWPCCRGWMRAASSFLPQLSLSIFLALFFKVCRNRFSCHGQSVAERGPPSCPI